MTVLLEILTVSKRGLCTIVQGDTKNGTLKNPTKIEGRQQKKIY
jgi:hypothetical protein